MDIATFELLEEVLSIFGAQIESIADKPSKTKNRIARWLHFGAGVSNCIFVRGTENADTNTQISFPEVGQFSALKETDLPHAGDQIRLVV